MTITLPDAGKRFMSLQIINEDHYVPFVVYDDTPHTLTEGNVGTRYVMVAIRTLVDPNDPKDLDEVHKLQDAIKVSQKEAGKLELPNWDQTSLKEIRDALLVLAKHTDGFKHAFGTKNASRSDQASDRHRGRLGRQSGQGCDLYRRGGAEERRNDRL